MSAYDAEHALDRTFDTPGPITLSVDVVVGDLQVVATERTDTLVRVRPVDPGERRDTEAAGQTRVDLSLGTVTVRGPRQPLFGAFGKVGGVEVLVEVPAGSALAVKLGVGGVRAAGEYGACKVRSGAGDVRVERAGDLSVTTGMGLIDVEQVTGDADLTSGSGGLRLGSVTGAATLKTANGESWVGYAGGDLRINSANGDITADRAGASLTANTANGNLRVGELVRGTTTMRTAAGRIEVGIRGGTAARLDVHTHHGRVRNEMSTAAGPATTEETAEVRARTAFGDILIRRAEES